MCYPSFLKKKKNLKHAWASFLKPNAQTCPHKSKHLASFYIAFLFFLIRFIINKTIKILFNLTIVFKYDYDFYGNINNIL